MLKKNLKIIIFLTFAVIIQKLEAMCLGTQPPTCLEDMEEGDTKEILDYVLSKYEEAQMKIVGELVQVRGNRVSRGNSEELNVTFKLIDNTPHDIFQNCVFAIFHRPSECEVISTYCNTFLLRPPRPMLERESLIVCDDGVPHLASELNEDAEETATEEAQGASKTAENEQTSS